MWGCCTIKCSDIWCLETQNMSNAIIFNKKFISLWKLTFLALKTRAKSESFMFMSLCHEFSRLLGLLESATATVILHTVFYSIAPFHYVNFHSFDYIKQFKIHYVWRLMYVCKHCLSVIRWLDLLNSFAELKCILS